MKSNIHNKASKAYAVKNLALEVKDIDPASRRVKIALSAFDTIDSDKDVIRPGAFAKSIQERGPESGSNRKIAFLRYHNWEHQIGKFIDLQETTTHLVATAELGRSTKANDAFLDYQDGIIREHSIGFNYIEDKMQLHEDGERSYFEIKEVILWEGSAVTFGANQLTPTIDVSKGNQIDQLAAINEEMNLIVKALKNGKGTDERLFELEMKLKQIQEKYNSLITLEPSVKDTIKNEPSPKEDGYSSFYLNL